MVDITLSVNGATCTGSPEARKTLADFLRDDLNLTGTHVGCEHGVCGACTLILDGRAVRSCLMLAIQAPGSEVTTIEARAGTSTTSSCPECCTLRSCARRWLMLACCRSMSRRRGRCPEWSLHSPERTWKR